MNARLRIATCGCLLAGFLFFTPSAPAQTPPEGRARDTQPSWLMPPVEGPDLHYKTFESRAARQKVSYLIYLPPGYDTTGTMRFPVVYWLHGIGGSQQGVPGMTARMTEAIAAGKLPPLIMVFVNGMIRSSYVDSADGKMPVETVAIKELIPHVDSTYRTIATRAGRMIEGFSMGGGGAAKWGFKHHELFGAISILDGALHKPDNPATGRLASSFQTIYGGDRAYFEASNPWNLATKHADQVKGRTTLRIVTRTTGLGSLNKEFSEFLTSLGVANEFHAIPGAPHSPGPLYEGLGDDNWAFYRRAFSSGTPVQTAAPGPGSPSASKPASLSSSAAGGFEIDDERWTYGAGDFALNGILLKPEGKGPFPAVLISHGLGGSAQSFGMTKAREMVKWGFVCIAPSYTHTGGPRGAAKGRQHPADYGASTENIRRAQTCLEILSRIPEVDAKRLFAYGHSMGGFVTIGLAASSADLLKAAAITGSGLAPREGYPAPSTATAAKIRAPFLMLHGSNDTVVRPEQSESLKKILDQNKVPNDRLVIDGQGHPIDQTMRDEVFRLIREWFVKHGAQTPTVKTR